jgi:hypothetical protein
MTLSGRPAPCRAGQPGGRPAETERPHPPRQGGQPIPHHVTGPAPPGPRAKVRLAAPTALPPTTGPPQRPPGRLRPPGGHRRAHPPSSIRPGSPSHPRRPDHPHPRKPASRAPAAPLRERSAPPDPGLPGAPHGTCPGAGRASGRRPGTGAAYQKSAHKPGSCLAGPSQVRVRSGT